MRFAPLLLRLLLCLALVAGGVAAAQAQVRTLLAQDAPARADMMMPDDADCHDGMADPASPAGHGDCCDAGLCDCACPVPVAPLFAAIRLAPIAPAATSPPAAIPARHRPPRLGDPLRPPIG
ncbi:MAG TPA: CopL family metal-binding regulatory protein [Lysobacter sp.]|nr:CopL family metal-binding regulatory protein [Lysobacter sp.]